MSEAAQQAAKEATTSETRKAARPGTFAAGAFAAQSPTSGLAAWQVERREPRPEDVQIEILYCGVCHSDLHQVRNEWKDVMPTVYPLVPGHEIVGRVTKVGSAVKKFKEGDMAAVGCMVDSCRNCPTCKSGEEQYCENFMTLTYNGEDKILGGVTYGGYSSSIVVDESICAARAGRSWTWRERRRCSAPASRRIRRCGTGTWAKGRRSASWDSAGWDTWA